MIKDLRMMTSDEYIIISVMIGCLVMGISVLLICLYECYLYAQRKYRARETERRQIQDRYYARVIFDKLRACSSISGEHPALNREVSGSIPDGPTNHQDGVDVKRRITWWLADRTAIGISASDVLPVKFQWRDLARPKEWNSRAGKELVRDFFINEDRTELIWDGVMEREGFKNDIAAKIFIIRLIYNISDTYLIPSELLMEAGLVYNTGDWVDEWNCTDRNDEIVTTARDIYPPAIRNIRLVGLAEVNHHGRSRWERPKSTEVSAKIRAYPQNARRLLQTPEIPDNECYFTFKAGGYYEKDQNPLNNSCEKGETAV